MPRCLPQPTFTGGSSGSHRGRQRWHASVGYPCDLPLIRCYTLLYAVIRCYTLIYPELLYPFIIEPVQ